MKNLFIGNLNFKTVEGDLKSAFEEYGPVKTCRIITERETGKSRGFGFVLMENEADAKSAMDGMQGAELDGRQLNVKEALPQPERGGR